MVIFSRSLALGKVASRYIQAAVVLNNKMGTSMSRSYSPNSSCDNQTSSKRAASTDSKDQYVEAEVCNQKDLQDNEMKVFDIGEDGKVLVVKQRGEIYAVGTKCTHYGAPLVNGALGSGRVRCPWHGACFSLKTGDIEDFPGFDSLPCYQVTVNKKGGVKVRAKKSDLESNKRIKEISVTCAPCEGNSVVIVGGGPSGATCAETLRNEGYTGRITLIAREPYLPYDRIKCSKIGVVPEIEKLQVRSQEYYDNAKIEILKGVEATKVEPEQKYVHLSNGNKLKYNALYLATGSKPRVPDIPGVDLKNVFTVREFADSVKILNSLGEDKNKNVVVLGLSFIGLEVAASCNDKAKSMTVVGTDRLPLVSVFGNDVGEILCKLFEDKGVKFEFRNTIVKFNGDENGCVTSVDLRNGTTLPADVVVMGVGTTLYTEFLKNSGLALQPNGAVTVNDKLQTNFDNIFAGGDIAFAPVFAAGNQSMSIGHVGLAQYHGRIAALNILKKDVPLHTVPYFWTMLFGKSIRYSGCGRPISTMIHGDVNEMKFVVFFFDAAEKVIGVASCMRDPIVSQYAEYTHLGYKLYKKDLEKDPFAWTKSINYSVDFVPK